MPAAKVDHPPGSSGAFVSLPRHHLEIPKSHLDGTAGSFGGAAVTLTSLSSSLLASSAAAEPFASTGSDPWSRLLPPPTAIPPGALLRLLSFCVETCNEFARREGTCCALSALPALPLVRGRGRVELDVGADERLAPRLRRLAGF